MVLVVYTWGFWAICQSEGDQQLSKAWWRGSGAFLHHSSLTAQTRILYTPILRFATHYHIRWSVKNAARQNITVNSNRNVQRVVHFYDPLCLCELNRNGTRCPLFTFTISCVFVAYVSPCPKMNNDVHTLFTSEARKLNIRGQFGGAKWCALNAGR